jgi:molecular chaperone DnaK (HSP70)
LSAISLCLNLRSIVNKTDNLTFVVPPETPLPYRRLLVNAAALVGFNSTFVLETATALSVRYVAERQKQGDFPTAKPHTVLFVDIGAESTELSLWKYERKDGVATQELLKYAQTSDVGGAYVDRALVDWGKTQVNRTLVPEDDYKLLALLRGAKENMGDYRWVTLNQTAQFNAFFGLSKDWFETATINLVAKLRDMVRQFDAPDEVELVGGASKMKVLTAGVNQALPNKTVSRTLPADEAALFGAVYHSVLQSGAISRPPVKIVKPALLGLTKIVNQESEDVYTPGEVVTEKKFTLPAGSKTIQHKFVSVGPQFAVGSPDFKTSELLNVTEEIALESSNPTVTLKYGISPRFDCPDLIEAIVSGTEVNIPLTVSSVPVDKDAASFAGRVASADEKRRAQMKSCEEAARYADHTKSLFEHNPRMENVTTSSERKQVIEKLEELKKGANCSATLKDPAQYEKEVAAFKLKFTKVMQRYNESIERERAERPLKMAIKRGVELLKQGVTGDKRQFARLSKLVKDTKHKLKAQQKASSLSQPAFLVEDMRKAEKEILELTNQLRKGGRDEL